MRGKKGQFFLIAAVVIIVVTVSVMTISNYTHSEENVEIDDLGEEMGIESGQVLEYWASEGKTNEELTVLMENFIDNYVNSLNDPKNIYFIFGNRDLVHFRGYPLLDTQECVCLTLNSDTPSESTCALLSQNPELCIPAQMSTLDNRVTQNFTITEGIDSVRTTVENQDYFTQISEGENFYFIIWENKNGEKHIVISGE